MISLFQHNPESRAEDGLWRVWHENGQLWTEGNYKDGKLDGLHRRWYDDGQLRWEYNYKDGELDGLFRSWHENGQRAYVINYKDGKLISEKIWDEDANLIKDETY